jgi:RNA polymerase sigma-70 factor (ECF subfamily)
MVALNRAIALGEARGAEKGLRALDALAGEEKLRHSPFLPAARGRLLLRAGRKDDAAAAFAEAERRGRNPAEAELFATLRERAGNC